MKTLLAAVGLSALFVGGVAAMPLKEWVPPENDVNSATGGSSPGQITARFRSRAGLSDVVDAYARAMSRESGDETIRKRQGKVWFSQQSIESTSILVRRDADKDMTVIISPDAAAPGKQPMVSILIVILDVKHPGPRDSVMRLP